MKVSLFQDFHKYVEDATIISVIERIKSDEFKSEITKVHQADLEGNDDLVKKLKNKLLAFTPSGVFNNGRKSEAINEYSQFIILDFDKLSLSALKEAKNNAILAPYTFAAFISPSGNGLKIIVKVDSSLEFHKTAFEQVANYYEQALNITIDSSGKDVSRLCFISWDDDCYINENGDVFNVAIESNAEQVYNYSDELTKCILFTDNKMTYVKGNRNNYVHLFSCNANRSGIPIEVTLDFVLSNFDLSEDEIKTAVKSAYNNQNEFGKFKPSLPEKVVEKVTPSDNDGFHLKSIEELIIRRSTEPKIPYLWSGIKVGSFGFIFGPSKAGKTTLCENLAFAIATGQEEFFNKPLTEGAKKVFFISLEEFWQNRTERNEKQIEHLNLPLNNNFYSIDENFPRLIDTIEDWYLLKNHIKKIKAEVVFIDSLSRLYSGSIEDSSLAKELLFKLRELSSELKITLIIIHHTPKQVGRPLTIDSLAGSRMLAQEADFMIGVSKTPDGSRYMKEVAFRYAPENDETVTTFIINENAWLIPTLEISEAALLKTSDGRSDESNADLLLEEIEEQTEKKGFATAAELLVKFEESKIMSKPTLFSRLNKMISKGKIEKINKGNYRVKP